MATTTANIYEQGHSTPHFDAPDLEPVADEPHQDSAAAPRPFDGEAGFARWFIANYPPGCTIHNPAWHAPKIWRAALSHRESGR